jgi:hypothetical protein
MEISEVRKRMLATIERSKQRAAERRGRADEAAKAYSTFIETIAVPMFRQVANVLKAEGYPFGLFTPAGSVKLVSDRHPQDAIEILFDSSGDQPLVMGHTTRSRGGRVVESERPVGDPASLSEADVLEFLAKELEPFVER